MRHLVDPALLPGLDIMPALDLTEESLPLIRLGMDQMTAMMPEPEGTGVSWREETIGPGVTVCVYQPTATVGLQPAILHIHGGGYVMGSSKISHAANMATASALEAIIVSVNYRLAPETPAPGSVEDCYAALRWLVAQADRLNVDIQRIAVQGESAGGGLAAALALLARDRGGPALVHQCLIYPMLDDRTCMKQLPESLGAFVWTPPANAFGWRALLGVEPGSANVPDYAVPARAETLAGLPSTFIAVGALDLFVVEDMDYARRLTEAGVATELHVYPGAYHGFDVLPDAPASQRMRQDALNALRRALHSGGTA